MHLPTTLAINCNFSVGTQGLIHYIRVHQPLAHEPKVAWKAPHYGPWIQFLKHNFSKFLILRFSSVFHNTVIAVLLDLKYCGLPSRQYSYSQWFCWFMGKLFHSLFIFKVHHSIYTNWLVTVSFLTLSLLDISLHHWKKVVKPCKLLMNIPMIPETYCRYDCQFTLFIRISLALCWSRLVATNTPVKKTHKLRAYKIIVDIYSEFFVE